MVFSNVIVDVTILRSSFVFGHSRAKVSAILTNVRSLVVAAFDLGYCSLSVLRFVFVLDVALQYTCCTQTNNHFTTTTYLCQGLLTNVIAT